MDKEAQNFRAGVANESLFKCFFRGEIMLIEIPIIADGKFAFVGNVVLAVTQDGEPVTTDKISDNLYSAKLRAVKKALFEWK